MCWAYWKETGEVPEEMGKVCEGCLQRPVWKGTYVINLNETHHSSNNTMVCCTADVQEALFLPHGLCFIKTSLITHGICPLPAIFCLHNVNCVVLSQSSPFPRLPIYFMIPHDVHVTQMTE